MKRLVVAAAKALTTIAATVFGQLLATFFIGSLMPIDPALAIAGDHASASAVAGIRVQLGLDQPLALNS